MKATMTAINPPHTNNIFSGKKLIEWRTFPLPMGLHYVYETKRCFGTGMVIGMFEVTGHFCFMPGEEIPKNIIKAGCVEKKFLDAYARSRALYANIITNAIKFDIPTTINEYVAYSTGQTLSRPPQSYVYIETDYYANFAQIE